MTIFSLEGAAAECKPSNIFGQFSVSAYLKSYDVILNAFDQGLGRFEIHDLLTEYATNALSQKRVPLYELDQVVAINNELSGVDAKWSQRYLKNRSQKGYLIFLDARTGLLLLYKKKPIAVVAFTPKDEALMIVQLQGIRSIQEIEKGKETTFPTRGLAPFQPWELLVSIAQRFAERLNFKQIGVQGSINNVWTFMGFGFDGPRLTRERAAVIYDYTATGLGFDKKSDGNYYKNLY